MKNCIDAHLEFSFKGETFSLSSTLDLDRLVEQDGDLPSIHALLAAQHGIDTHSYLYEVMQEEPVRFDHAQGAAAEFLNGEEFNLADYAARWQDRAVFASLQAIAQRELGVTDLNQQPRVRNALLHAYHLGRRSAP